MHTSKNISIAGANGKLVLMDIFFTREKPQPVVIYAHGFNGFKDWANFDLIAMQFAERGFCFIKFNFSHGGTSPEAPDEFTNLEAYGNNNYTKELEDLQHVLNWALSDENRHQPFIDKNEVYLIGHSRGGGVVLLTAAEDKRVKAVATWASVSQSKTPWGSWPEDRLQQWKESGVEYYTNSRTKQQMPLYYQLYQNYQNNKERLNIISAAGRLTVPLLLCHGALDEAVPFDNALTLKDAAPHAELFPVASDHVFERKHPWPGTELPAPMQAVVDKTIQFFQTVPEKR